MKKRGKRGLWLLVPAVFTAVWALWFFLYIPRTAIAYDESEKVMANPCRGFYCEIDTADLSELAERKEEGGRLVLLNYDLKEEREGEISPEKLSELKNALESVREQGLRAIFRAAYGFGPEYAHEDAEELETVLAQIGQVAPLLNDYGDTVLCVQAGFLGPWGEWHHSRLLEGTEEENTQVRNRVLMAWDEALKPGIPVGVRKPRFVRDAVEAGLSMERFGIHNDALLADGTDMDTYDDPDYTREEELTWIGNELKYGINGGEMPALSDYAGPENALLEFQAMRLTYLNGDYNQEVLDSFREQELEGEPFYETISKRMGYRFYVSSLDTAKRVRSFQRNKLKFTLKNTGFAPIAGGYSVNVTVEDGEGKSSVYPAGGGKLSGIEPGKTESFSAEFRLPPCEEGKMFQIGLSLAGSRDSVELANDLPFEDGVNALGYYIRTKGGYSFLPLQGEDAEEGSLEVTLFKIGKADAILIEEGEKTVLIDTGEDEDAEEILDYLGKKGKERIDYLILTHFDKDHVGGADKLLLEAEVGKIYQPDYVTDKEEYLEYTQTLKELGITPVLLKKPLELSLGEAELTVCPPLKNAYEESDNDFSLVTGVRFGGTSFLFTGDAESERLGELLDQGVSVYDFLKMPHHGREGERLEEFVDAVSPAYAVITCSDKNPPDEEVLDLLHDRGIETYLTKDGDVHCVSDGRTIQISQ